MRRLITLIVLCASVAALVMLHLRAGSSSDSPRASAGEAHAGEALAVTPPARQLVCNFAEGDRAAFRVESRVALSGGDADRLSGTLSWEVERASTSQRGATLRAALRHVQLQQDMSALAERADASRIEAGVFSLQVGTNCRFAAISFDRRFDAASEQLVRSLLESAEVVLDPSAADWTAPQQDGVGSYLASYVRRGQSVERTKDSYDPNPLARQMGVQLQVVGSRLSADVDVARGGWMRRLVSRERVVLRMADQPPRLFDHQLTIRRDDAAFQAVVQGPEVPARVMAAGPAAAHTPKPVDPVIAAMSREQVEARVRGLFDERGRSAALAAAQLLAEWLRAHPDQTFAWLDGLRAGSIDPRAHAALFLGFQLSGTSEARDALAAAVLDEALSDMNRARAASALADHGEPNDLAAGLLQQQVRQPTSPLVANSSLLGLGTMAGRAEGPLQEQLRSFLREEAAAATGLDATVAALDAIGNSRDPELSDVLAEQLAQGGPLARRHAAQALARVTPNTAHAALLDHLAGESEPGVRLGVLKELATLPSRPFDERDRRVALALLGSEHAEERAAAIDWLGKVADAETRRALLAEHFRVESDARLRQHIGQFVSAADLRAVALTRAALP